MDGSKFWAKVIGEGWYNLAPGLWDSKYMANVMEFTIGKYKSATIFPEQRNLFRAFRLTPLEDVKVVILGQDPYYTEIQGEPVATGLAFANNDKSISISPSLEKIWRAVERTEGLDIDFDITLEKWAKQGVLLLNTALTVEKFSPTSHLYVWRKMVQTVIMMISLKKNDIHFCLWGNKAREFEQFIAEGNHIHTFVHPAYAARQNTDWNCEHFKEINNHLKDKIVW